MRLVRAHNLRLQGQRGDSKVKEDQILDREADRDECQQRRVFLTVAFLVERQKNKRVYAIM